MTRSQKVAARDGADAEHELLGRLATETIMAEVDGYGDCLTAEVREDVMRANVCSARLYTQMVHDGRPPSHRGMAPLSAASRRRVHQGLALESVLRAYRVGTKAIWERTVERGGDDVDLRRLTDLTLRYIDRVSTNAEVEYLAERDELLNSRSEAMSLLLSRVAEGDFADANEIEHAAARLGYQLSGASTATVIGVAFDDADVVDHGLPDLVAELRRGFPGSLCAVVRRDVLLVVPSPSTANLGTLLRPIMEGSSYSRRWIAGVGRAGAGVAGLRTSIHEAERARTLARILHPDGGLYRYEDVRFFDLFKQGAPINDFVETVLVPFIDHDRERNTQLVRTLYAYYSEGASRKAAAARLHIHPNTLDYRLRQAEAVAGGSIAAGEFSFRFLLALRLLPISDKASLIVEPV